MVAGMLPSALGVGDGGEFRAPMAIAVIGGLIVSTVLVARLRAVVLHGHGRSRQPRSARLLGGFVGPRDEPDETEPQSTGATTAGRVTLSALPGHKRLRAAGGTRTMRRALPGASCRSHGARGDGAAGRRPASVSPVSRHGSARRRDRPALRHGGGCGCVAASSQHRGVVLHIRADPRAAAAAAVGAAERQAGA